MHVCEPKSQFKIFIEKHRTKNIKDTLEEEKKMHKWRNLFYWKTKQSHNRKYSTILVQR